MYSEAVRLCAEKAGLSLDRLDILAGGDLLNQIVSAGSRGAQEKIHWMLNHGAEADCAREKQKVCEWMALRKGIVVHV